MSDESPAYRNLKLPTAFCDEMDKIIEKYEVLGFKSRAEMAKQAIRQYIERLKESEGVIEFAKRMKAGEDEEEK